MSNPFFSIIMPTYNRADLITRAIESVINQDCQDWELIIIDDGSTDNTKEVVTKIINSRIKYHYQTNQERSTARNNGIKFAIGLYICFLDSDDYYLNNHLSNFCRVIKENNLPVAMFYCDTYEDRNGILTPYSSLDEKVYKNNIDFALSNIIGVPRTCIHSSILADHQFNPKLRIGEDLELWMRILRKSPLIYTNKFTVVYTEHEQRTVNEKTLLVYNDWLDLIRSILEKNKKHISKRTRIIEMSRCYYFLGHYYASRKHKLKMYYYLIKSLYIAPKWKTKEKIVMMLDNVLFTRILRLIIKKIK